MSLAAGFPNPMTAVGDLISGGTSGAPTRLAGDTSNIRKFLRELSTAGVAAAPAWDTIAAGDISALAALWTGYLKGFPLTYGSTTTLIVGYPGANGPTSLCRDKADAAFISVAPGTTYTITITTNAAALGDDSLTGAGTVAFNNSTTITGTSTTFKTSFVTRTLTGTSAVTAGTALVGTGTKYLSEVAVNDLVGNSTGGWARVTAIASDTALTLSQSMTLTSTCSCVEQPTITLTSDTAAGGTTHQVDKITSDTSLLTTEATAGGSFTGKAYQIGRRYARAAVSASQYLYVWVGSGGSGTTAYVSTQRTTPFGITGYNTSVRRVGSVLLDSSGNVVQFSQQDFGGGGKLYTLSIVSASATARILNGVASTSWTAANCNIAVPPTSTLVYLAALLQANVQGGLFFERRGLTAPATSTNLRCYSEASGFNNGNLFCPTDGAQALQYVLDSGSNQAYVDVIGYVEVL